MNIVSIRKSLSSIIIVSLFLLLITPLLEPAASSWNINCSPSDVNGNPECTMQQEIIMKNSQLPVLQLTLAQLDKEEPPHALLIVPLGLGQLCLGHASSVLYFAQASEIDRSQIYV